MIVNADIKFVKRTVFSDQKFSILIPTWNNLAYLQLCIEALAKILFLNIN